MKIRKYWEANFLVLEFITALVLSLCLVGWSEFIDKGQFINSIFLDNRDVVYGALATLFGSMLGFSITAVSIVIGYATNDKLAIVRKGKHYQDLWNVFKSAMKVLAFATVFALLGLVFDKNANPVNYLLYMNIFATVLSLFRIARCIWVLENIIVIVTKP
jgi:hypothetical protein